MTESPCLHLLVATRSPGKVAELRRLFEGLPLSLLTPSEFGSLPRVDEDGESFEHNARNKACVLATASGLLALADDSGLEVDALGGAPGVVSARFAGPRASDEDNNRALLARLDRVPLDLRSARFRCVLALAEPAASLRPRVQIAHGVCEGRVALQPRGRGGFGYDPLFVPRGMTLTMAEVDPETKNRISHRARAAATMRTHLQTRLGYQRPKPTCKLL
ncbi:MAG: non-canonical purine NTP pyrophosphatase [Proteobacteria bacterium]|nr:non-canonical purine NTP pyrophosphatase [Pseudomonadota bacterium]